MKIHRFYVANIEFKEEKIYLTDKNLLNQLLNVFRFRSGANFVVFDGTGTDYLVELVASSKKEIVCELKEEKNGLKRNKKLNLVFSMIKKENMEYVLEKCTELGVTNFVPVISERTVKTGWNMDRAEKIVIEAVEQSGWSDLPVLHEPQKLPKVLDNMKAEKGNVDSLCVLDFDGVPLSSVKHLVSVDTVIVGPEGGFTDKERSLFEKMGIKKISLGMSTLRAETASICASSIFLL